VVLAGLVTAGLISSFWSLTTLLILLGVLGAVPGVALIAKLPSKR
jgi:hypothetical protein